MVKEKLIKNFLYSVFQSQHTILYYFTFNFYLSYLSRFITKAQSIMCERLSVLACTFRTISTDRLDRFSKIFFPDWYRNHVWGHANNVHAQKGVRLTKRVRKRTGRAKACAFFSCNFYYQIYLIMRTKLWTLSNRNKDILNGVHSIWRCFRLHKNFKCMFNIHSTSSFSS